MEIYQLRYFAYAAKYENITMAAQELHVSQPSISKAIQALERELNTELLRKNGRSCVLTHDGYLLQEKISPVLEELERIPLEFRNSEKKKKKTDPVKIAMCIFCTLGGLIFVGMLCYSILKSKVSLDSILSTLLAFFSIFIAIFFYFKADETSTRFYESSYKFMKDISVTLGKIEERFGEKLNNLNEKISHLDYSKDHYNQEIKNIETDKDAMINEIISKTGMSE